MCEGGEEEGGLDDGQGGWMREREGVKAWEGGLDEREGGKDEGKEG